MLAIRQYIVGVNVGHDVGADDVFENFADYAGQRDRSIINCKRSVALFNERADVCVAPVIRQRTIVEGLLKNELQGW